MSRADDLTIRTTLRPGDVEEIVGMHRRTYAREHGFDETFAAYVAEPLGAFARGHARRERIWIAERDGRIVGCVAIVSADDRTAQLRWFLVDRAAHGAGLGRRLLTEAVAFARECGYETIILWPVAALTAAAHLYTSAGFRRVSAQSQRLWGVDDVEEKYELALRSPH
jgi:N-acetylglutamate synthase-like GNAT family acetyltransferase